MDKEFQSPNRDSFLWNVQILQRPVGDHQRFNPLIGILFFGTNRKRHKVGITYSPVSIP